MPGILRPAIALVFLATLVQLLCAPPARAQQPVADDQPATQWYQVEVFIFANDDPNAANQESWRTDLGLKYPQRIVRLNEHHIAETPTALPGATAATDTIAQTNVAVQTNNTTNNTSEELAFTDLEPEQMQLNAIAARISRQRYFRPLFHKAWRQPVADRDESSSILIRGGDQYDDHYELEGSINLSVERYLHIKTDLWLSTFVSAAGIEDTLWPVLPRLPIASAAEYVEEDPLQRANSALLSTFDANSPYLNFSHRDYIVDRTVALRQSRRMRSGELHYIDHPLLGLLVKVTPYDPAAAEADDEADTVTQ